MIIDCDSCTVRGAACTDCVVTFLTIPVRRATAGGTSAHGGATPPRACMPGPASHDGTGATATAGAARGAVPAGPGPGARVDLDDAERAAIGVLASSGLVPPLRMERAM